MEFHFDKPDSRPIKGEIGCRRILRYLLFDLITVPATSHYHFMVQWRQTHRLGARRARRFWKFPFEKPKSHFDHLTDMRQGQRI